MGASRDGDASSGALTAAALSTRGDAGSSGHDVRGAAQPAAGTAHTRVRSPPPASPASPHGPHR